MRLLLLGLVLAAATAAGDDASPILAAYDFERDEHHTGPDTFAIFQHARGSVALSDAFARSGWRSAELRDVAGDGDFPELQGYLPLRRTGRVYARFSFLTTVAEEELNFALAGPAWFTAGKDGIAFRLTVEDGVLRHVSDAIPRRLLNVQPFTWYDVDVGYDIEAGRYDLTVREEHRAEPLVDLTGQPNAANVPGSAVDKFSFIGDPGTDRSDVVYYVDDVVVGTDRAVRQHPFVAPGRRRLFVERFLRDEARQVEASGSDDERRYHALAAARRFGEARDLALEASSRGAATEWLRRAGDACFLLRDLPEARLHYEAALNGEAPPAPLLLRLADVAFLEGDAAGERSLRERYYGALKPR